MTFTLKMHLMTRQLSFLQVWALCTCSVICVTNACGLMCEWVCSTVLPAQFSQQCRWHIRASSISSLSQLKVHLCEWCWSAISSNTEESGYLSHGWPSSIHIYTNYKQSERFEPSRKSPVRGILGHKVARKWNPWWDRWRATNSEQRVWKDIKKVKLKMCFWNN